MWYGEFGLQWVIRSHPPSAATPDKRSQCHWAPDGFLLYFIFFINKIEASVAKKVVYNKQMKRIGWTLPLILLSSFQLWSLHTIRNMNGVVVAVVRIFYYISDPSVVCFILCKYDELYIYVWFCIQHRITRTRTTFNKWNEEDEIFVRL